MNTHFKNNLYCLCIFLLLVILMYGHSVDSDNTCPPSLPKNFVYLDEVDSSIEQSIVFATNNNFVGRPLDGYGTERAVCTQKAALALSKAQKELKARGLCLRVSDAYRPTQAVKHLHRCRKKIHTQKNKKHHDSPLKKKKSLEKFLATGRSSHSRGSSFDVAILNDRTKERIDLGSSHFGKKSSPYSSNITKKQRHNRLLLRKIMLHHNFKPYDYEWWHFTLKNEPYPSTYFNFPIE